MTNDEKLLKIIVFLYTGVRRLYLSGKISRSDWLYITDEITKFIEEEIM